MSKPALKSHPVPNVGDVVNLNNHGLDTIYGLRVGLGHMKSMPLIVTKVGKTSLTSPEETFEVEVDSPEINSFLMNHWCFDIVCTTKAEPRTESSPPDGWVVPPPEPPKSEDWGSF